MQRKHSIIFLVLLVFMGQGSLFVHDMNHVVNEEASDCLLCIKLDKQEHGLPAAGLMEFAAPAKHDLALTPHPNYDIREWRSHVSRAPPVTV